MKAIRVIPKELRPGGYRIAGSLLLRAALNFAGVALVLPVLTLILDPSAIHSDSWIGRLFRATGFRSEAAFAGTTCLAIWTAILLKNGIEQRLCRIESDYLHTLYGVLSRRLYRSYLGRGLEFIRQRSAQHLARNVNAATLHFVTGVLRPMAVMAADGVLVALLMTALCCYRPLLTAIVLLVLAPLVWSYRRLIRRRMRQYGRTEYALQRRRFRSVTDTCDGYAEIELAGTMGSRLDAFDRLSDRIVAIRRRRERLALLPKETVEIGITTALVLIAMAGHWSSRPETAKATFALFALVLLRTVPSLRNIMTAWNSIRYNNHTIDLLLQDSPATVFPADVRTDGRIAWNEELRIEHLSFSYADNPDRKILDDLSFTIRKGERIGIRGASGSGKTTLVLLLLGLYEPQSGNIRIDGVPLEGTTRQQWRNTAGYVSQDVFLSEESIARNIAPGPLGSQIDPGRLEAAIRRADLQEFVAQLPEGADTPIGERGIRISGGERQRIGIARALYKKADILFLDEATSALDRASEERIERAIERLSHDGSMTIVVVSHRERMLEHCDRILTLD